MATERASSPPPVFRLVVEDGQWRVHTAVEPRRHEEWVFAPNTSDFRYSHSFLDHPPAAPTAAPHGNDNRR